ncbi:MAG TPA: FAD-binding oxidoreductase [Acidimicrobiales bacterium]|nr:FAD-binding oxidoreductase [Acidimicrobiales bacterium]
MTRGEPTPPIELRGTQLRLSSPRVEPSDATLEALASICPVSTDEADVVEHGRDWWPLAMVWAVHAGAVPARPAAVVRPTTAEEVADVLAVCDEAHVPVTPAAGRSGVCGAAVPVHGGVVLDLCGLSGIVGVDDESLLLDVRPGTFGDVLEDELRAHHGVTLGHWPQSMALSTVGGWLACRSAGQYSTRYGKVEDMVVGLEVALADGRVVRTGGAGPRAAVGPDLSQLFVGSEGTLGVITEARLRVHPVPPVERRAAYAFDSFADGLDACRRILRRGATPAVLRLYDDVETKRGYQLDDWHLLIVLDEGDEAVVEGTMRVVAEECAKAEPLPDELVGRWLAHRNDTSALQSVVTHGIVVDTTEISARWSALPRIYDEVLSAARAVDGMLAVSAHQSHSYTDGACVYFTWAGRREGDGWQDAFYREAWDAVTTTVLARGGTLSHHHGVGLHRGRYMADALGPALDVLVSLKQTLDPHGILNPGKLGLPSPWGARAWP